MASTKVVETIYGDKSKYEIIKKKTAFTTKFYVKRDGDTVSGSFKSLNKAVDAAKNKY